MRFFNQFSANTKNTAMATAWAAGATGVAYMFAWGMKERAKIFEEYAERGEYPPTMKGIAGCGAIYVPPTKINSMPHEAEPPSNPHYPK